MDSFDSLKMAMDQANQALAAGDRSAALNALGGAKLVLEVRFAGNGGFDGIVAMQTVEWALRAGDASLALDLAALLLRQTARELEQLNTAYQARVDAKQFKEAREVSYRAYACARTFVPRVLAPPIPWLLAAFAGVSPQEAGALAVLRKVARARLNDANWQEWKFPEDAAGPADLAAATTLLLIGNEIMQNPLSGELVEESLHLALNAMALIPRESRTRPMADAKSLLARVYNELGIIHHEEALELFEEAIAMEEELHLPEVAARDHMNAGAVALSLALHASAQPRAVGADAFREKARAHLVTARDYFRTNGPPTDLRNTLNNLGSFYSYGKDFTRAIEAYEEAWKLLDPKEQDAAYSAVVLAGNLGSNYLETGNYEKSYAFLKLAGDILDSIQLPEALPYLMCHGNMGKLLCKMEKFPEARISLKKSLAKLESLRASFVSENTNLQLLKNFHWVYEWSIFCLANLAQTQPGLWAEAFELAERVKWRLLSVLLRYLPLGMAADGGTAGDASAPLLAEEQNLLAETVSALDRPAEAALLRDDSAQNRLEELWSKLEPQYPLYVMLRRQQTVTAAQASQLLDEQVSTLVEYYLGEETGAAIAFVLRSGGAAAAGAILPASRDEVIDMVRRVREQEQTDPVEEFNRRSRDLHRALIAPILPELAPGGGICFVPYGEMHNLAFGSLFDGSKYLVESWAMVIAPSASALRWWRAKDTHRTGNCLLFTATRDVRDGTVTLPPLDLFRHLAEKEIAPLFPKHEFAASPPATKEDLLKSLTGAWDVVHIACHGIAREDGLESFLAMAGESLTVMQIMSEVRGDPALVTLSACQSAVAQSSTGDEVCSLAQAFLVAGAASVLATNAEVRQDSGNAIARTFYEYWLGKQRDGKRHSKLESLRLAQLAAMNQKGWFGWGSRTWHPQQWGVFQLYGSWS